MFHLPILLVWQSRVSPHNLADVIVSTIIGIMFWPVIVLYALGVGYVKLCRGT